MDFRDALNQDMLDNHFNPGEFGEVVEYVQASGPTVSIPGMYDEPALSQDIGAEVQAISHQPRLFVRKSDLPSGSPKKGDRVVLSANAWHEASTMEVVSTASEKLGHVELVLLDVST